MLTALQAKDSRQTTPTRWQLLVFSFVPRLPSFSASKPIQYKSRGSYMLVHQYNGYCTVAGEHGDILEYSSSLSL